MVRHVDKATVRKGYQMILQGLGLDLNDPDLKDTPARCARAIIEMTDGLDESVDEHLSSVFVSDTPIAVPVAFRNIHAVGICPHHLQPVIYEGEVTIASRSGKVVGLSKIYRAVKVMTRRPILQESLTADIAMTFAEKLDAKVTVALRGQHMCIVARGVKEHGSAVETFAEAG